MDTHLNCIDKSMQFKWQPKTYAFIKKKKSRQKYTGCNLKTTKSLDCALIGVCAVIRSKTVILFLVVLGTLGRFSATFDKGDNFSDSLFAFLYISPLLKKSVCSSSEQFFKVNPFSEGSKTLLIQLSP